MFLLIKTNARILDLRPVSDFPPCSSGRIPIQGDDKEHLDKHVGFDRWKCDIIHMGLLLVRPLYYYYNVKNKEQVAPLINFILSPEGQEIIKKSGYIPVK